MPLATSLLSVLHFVLGLKSLRHRRNHDPSLHGQIPSLITVGDSITVADGATEDGANRGVSFRTDAAQSDVPSNIAQGDGPDAPHVRDRRVCDPQHDPNHYQLRHAEISAMERHINELESAGVRIYF